MTIFFETDIAASKCINYGGGKCTVVVNFTFVSHDDISFFYRSGFGFCKLHIVLLTMAHCKQSLYQRTVVVIKGCKLYLYHYAWINKHNAVINYNIKLSWQQIFIMPKKP